MLVSVYLSKQSTLPDFTSSLWQRQFSLVILVSVSGHVHWQCSWADRACYQGLFLSKVIAQALRSGGEGMCG